MDEKREQLIRNGGAAWNLPMTQSDHADASTEAPASAQTPVANEDEEQNANV